MKTIHYIMTLALFLSGWTTAYAIDPPEEASVEQLARGKRLYQMQCFGCHGADGEDTSRGEGTKTLPGISIRKSDFVIGHRFRGFTATLISDQERADLVAFVKTLKGKKGYERPEYLINAVGLEPFITETDVRIVDMRPLEAYTPIHLPNAIHFDVSALQPLPHTAAFARLMEDIGIGDETYVVIYDDNGGRSAALLWTALQHYGHTRVSILDGGWQKWKMDGYQTTRWKPSKRTVTFTPRPRMDILAEESNPAVNAIYLNVQPPNASSSRYAQDAIRIDWSSNLHQDGTFRPASELLTLYEASGITTDRTVFTAGNDPSTAAQVLFTLRLLGYSDVRLYGLPRQDNQKASEDKTLRQIIELAQRSRH